MESRLSDRQCKTSRLVSERSNWVSIQYFTNHYEISLQNQPESKIARDKPRFFIRSIRSVGKNVVCRCRCRCCCCVLFMMCAIAVHVVLPKNFFHSGKWSIYWMTPTPRGKVILKNLMQIQMTYCCQSRDSRENPVGPPKPISRNENGWTWSKLIKLIRIENVRYIRKTR